MLGIDEMLLTVPVPTARRNGMWWSFGRNIQNNTLVFFNEHKGIILWLLKFIFP